MDHIGARVRYWRERRKLPRKQFADMVGRSASWLDKIESGERELARLPMIERVAEVLGIDPLILTDDSCYERVSQCVDPQEVQAIRMALADYPGLRSAPAAPADLEALTRQSSYLDHAWTMSRFTVVARHLPVLIAEAQIAVQSSPDELTAHRVLVTAYRAVTAA